MCRRKGFTLVEMLFVVLIAAAILVFSVPAYKRVQEKADYNAALGILLDVSNAVDSLERDLNVLSTTAISFPRSKAELSESNIWTIYKFSEDNKSHESGTFDVDTSLPWNQWLINRYKDSGNIWNKHFWGALFKFGYLKNIPNTEGYTLYVTNGEIPDTCAGTSASAGNIRACMQKSGTKNDCYKGAVVLNDGSVLRIKGSNCAN